MARVITDIARNRTLKRVALYAILMAVYAAIPTWLETNAKNGTFTNLPSDIHTALTLVLGWLLVFRTNASYSRWWEARTLWGSLVNTSRILAIKVSDLVQATDDELDKFQKEIVAFCHALRDHLRAGATLNTLPGFHDAEDAAEHVPGFLVARMYEEVGTWKRNGVIDGDDLRILDTELRRFLDICGGCERIRNTRIARSYRTFARQCVFLYLATFPWGIVFDFHLWTVPLTAIVSYFMLGLETVAEDVEEPFGRDEDDLDLDGLCNTIEKTVTEVMARRRQRRASDGVSA